jgi:hypothetical protein
MAVRGDGKKESVQMVHKSVQNVVSPLPMTAGRTYMWRSICRLGSQNAIGRTSCSEQVRSSLTLNMIAFDKWPFDHWCFFTPVDCCPAAFGPLESWAHSMGVTNPGGFEPMVGLPQIQGASIQSSQMLKQRR